MTSRPYARAAAIAAALLSFAVPTTALAANASDGGTGTGTTTTSTATTPTTTSTTASTTSTSGGGGLGATTPGSTTTTATATPVGGPVSTSGNGFSLTTTGAGTFKKALSFSGSAPVSDSGETLVIQRETPKGAWVQATTAAIAGDGSFTVAWKPTISGVTNFRATLAPPSGAASAADADPAPASPALAVTIYRNAIATIYGPGFYGKKTACGKKLTSTMLGVASRTLKCGTKVSINYNGQSITVPVIDRGPYANNATWDLTEATAQTLGDEETETVGAAVV